MAEEQRPANRQFYSLPSTDVCSSANSKKDEAQAKGDELDKTKDFFKYICADMIGADKTFSGPFGLRTVVYLDFVASGRALNFIEDYIRYEVLPEYGNTHTTTSVTSLQTTLFRHEARDILRNSFNASEHDSVIFTGSGSTGAVHKLIHAMHLEKNPSVVLVGPYEHHSNILPWKEAGAEVIRIKQTEMGLIDMNHLEATLKALQSGSSQVIGAFSAASNVTGVMTDVDAVTICLHRHKALAVWDYACAAPYVKLDMNPYIGGPDQKYVYKDAVVLSVHKFVGGISTPGVLMAKKKLFKNPVPEGCGGGSVFFVRRDNHRYLQEPESKEEGGTPAIVQSIRAGLVVQLRDAVGLDVIYNRDQWLLSQAQAAWHACQELIQLGPPSGPQSPDKLPIFSFLVLHRQTGRFLHHNFVAAVLNDVFGIQARGGCACAGPYAMDLLGLEEKTAKAIEDLIAEDSRLDRTHLRRIREYSHREILRPGFVRLNLPYFMDDECLQFVLEAVKMAAENAWMLLPQYLFNPETAEWRQRHFQTFKDRKWIGHISYHSGKMKYHVPKQITKGPLPTSYQDCLMKAKEVFENSKKLRLKIPDQSALFDKEASKCRWFLLPSEASACLLQHQGSSSLPPKYIPPDDMPFFPGRSVQHNVKQDKTSVQPENIPEDDGRQKPHEVDSSLKANEKIRKGNETINSVGEDGVQAVAESDSGLEKDVSCRGNGISALEEAMKYADVMLEERDMNEITAAVDNVMSNIWQKFKMKGPEYTHMRNSKSSRDHVLEVTVAMSQIRNLFSSENGLSGSDGKEADQLDTSAGLSKTPPVNRESNKSDKPCGVSLLSLSSAADVTNDGPHQIWQGFNSEKEQGSMGLLQLEANNSYETRSPVPVWIDSNSTVVDETCEYSGVENGLSAVVDANCTEISIQKTLRKIESFLTLNPIGDDSNLADEILAIEPKNPIVCDNESSDNTVMQIQNVMNEIWKEFTPTRPKCAKTDVKCEKTVSYTIEAKYNKASEVANGMQENEVKTILPVSKEIDTELEIFSKSKSNLDNVAKIKSAISEIWELFTPGQDNEKLEQTSNRNTKPNKLAKLENAMHETWKKCYGTESGSTITREEGIRTDGNLTNDNVAEVTDAMSEIQTRFGPENKMLNTGDIKFSCNLSANNDTKRDDVVEVVNTMNKIWAHFTLQHAKDNAEEGKVVPVNSALIDSETEMDKTMSNLSSRQDHHNGKDSKVISAINHEQNDFKSTASEKVTAEEFLKPNFLAQRVPENSYKMVSKQADFTKHLEKDSHHQGIKLHVPLDSESAQTSINTLETHHGPDPAGAEYIACPLIKHEKQLLNKSTQRGSFSQIKLCVQWFSPPKQIFKPAVNALEEYAMLKDGDRVLVCVSGGKDSLSLLHTIRQYQFYARGKGILFEFGAVTVDPMTPAYDPSPLIQYMGSLGVPYFYESQCILETAEQLPYECASICSFCSRMKRGRLYAAARREGYNVLALGQHLDDLTESFLMSFFHNGNLNTMKAHYTVKQGDLRVIRPLVYVREAFLRAFAEQCKLPIIAENCPACFEAPKERHRTKQLLAAQEVMFPQVYSSMMTALKPLMARGRDEKVLVLEEKDDED